MTTPVRGFISTIFSATLVNITVLISGNRACNLLGQRVQRGEGNRCRHLSPHPSKVCIRRRVRAAFIAHGLRDSATLVVGQMLQRIGSNRQCIVRRRTGREFCRCRIDIGRGSGRCPRAVFKSSLILPHSTFDLGAGFLCSRTGRGRPICGWRYGVLGRLIGASLLR